MAGKLVLLIGPSGVGKSAILHELRDRHPDWHFPRSATTRPQREGERDDLYQFLSNDEFDQFIEGKKVLEWAEVHEGARYGTLIDEIIPFVRDGSIVVREVDVQGFDSIRTHKLFRSAEAPYRLQSIFVLPESKGQLVDRITKRAPIDQGELDHRIASMEKELTYADRCDHQVVNAEWKLKEAVSAVERLIV